MVRSLLTPSQGNYLDYAKVILVTACVTAAGWFLPLSYLALGYVYLLAIIVTSTQVGRMPALVSAVLSSLAWNFFFVPPRLTFSVPRLDESFLLIIYFVVALICSQLASLRFAANRATLLAESEKMHQALFGNVGHELKTPLSVFRMAVEQLDTADTERRAQLVLDLRIAVRRLESLVSNLLSLTRLESGVLRPRLDWCHARDLVAAARRSLGNRLERRTLLEDFSLELPMFRADASLMEEAIGHLLFNAAVHTPLSSEIRVGAALSADHHFFTITVADDGPGVPPEMVDRLFAKFSRGDTARPGGLGLGLSIVRGFMAAQRGDVNYFPGRKGGSIFMLRMPYSPFPDPTSP